MQAANATDKLEQAVLALCEKKHLSKITVTDILNQSGVKKCTFYKHFQDINDLYHFIYWEKIAAPCWPGLNRSYNDYLNVCIINTKKIQNRYGKFFLQAIETNGQNSLKEYIIEHSAQFEFEMAKDFYQDSQYGQLMFACKFYTYGWIEARCNWIKSGYQTPAEIFAKQICDSRFALLTWFMFNDEKKKPFMEFSLPSILSSSKFPSLTT